MIWTAVHWVKKTYQRTERENWFKQEIIRFTETENWKPSKRLGTETESLVNQENVWALK